MRAHETSAYVPPSIFSFQLHDNALELHKYTRLQKMMASHGEGEGFDGELDNFQEPVLSSLAKLVCVHHTMMWPAVDRITFQGHGRSSKIVIHAQGAMRTSMRAMPIYTAEPSSEQG